MYKVQLPAPNLSKVLDNFTKKNKIYFDTELTEILENKKEFSDDIKASIYDLCSYCYKKGQEDIIEHIKRLEKDKCEI